jgi:AcrR family transcriptional regulator
MEISLNIGKGSLIIKKVSEYSPKKMGVIMSNKEITKKKILDTAIRMISASGFNATTTAGIAREAGLSEAIIYKYFRDKQSLLKAIATQAIGEIIENLSLIPLRRNIEESRDFPPREFIKSIIVERLHFLDRNHEMLKVLLMEIQYNQSLYELAQNTLFKEIDEIIRSVQDVLAVKLQISGEETRSRMWLCSGILLSMAVQKYFLQSDLELAGMEREIDKMLAVVLPKEQA